MERVSDRHFQPKNICVATTKMSWTGVVETWRTSRKRAFTCQRLGSSPPRCQVLTTKSARKLTASADYSGDGSVWHCESRQVRWPAIVRPGVLPFNSRASRLCFLPCTKQSPTTPAASQRIQVSCNTPFRNLHQSKKQRSRFLLRLAFSRRFYLFTDAAASQFSFKEGSRLYRCRRSYRTPWIRLHTLSNGYP